MRYKVKIPRNSLILLFYLIWSETEAYFYMASPNANCYENCFWFFMFGCFQQEFSSSWFTSAYLYSSAFSPSLKIHFALIVDKSTTFFILHVTWKNIGRKRLIWMLCCNKREKSISPHACCIDCFHRYLLTASSLSSRCPIQSERMLGLIQPKFLHHSMLLN